MAEITQTEDYAKDGSGKKFCFVDWGLFKTSPSGSIQYMDTPEIDFNTPLAERIFTTRSYTFRQDEPLESFLKRMVELGWQVTRTSRDHESIGIWMMRCPELDPAFEHCVLTSKFVIQPSGRELDPTERGLYRLGKDNGPLLPPDTELASYNTMVHVLAEGKWEVYRKEEYEVKMKYAPGTWLRFQFFRRPLAG